MSTEFKKISSNQNQTVYVLESATGGDTSAGAVSSNTVAVGGVQRRKPKDSIIVQSYEKKIPASVPRNFVAKNAKTGGAGAHKDKKKAAKQGDVKHKKPFAEAFQNDEANLYYRYDTSDGRLKKRMVDNNDERQAFAQGFKDTTELALKAAGIIRSKFDPKKFIQNQGGKWVQVFPYGEDQGVSESERRMSRAAKGYEKYGKKGMMALAKAGRDGKDLDKIRDKYDKYNESIAESILKEDIMGAPRPEDNHEASMALSELYRNAKYGMALLKIIEPNDAIDGWVQANLTSAADMLDKVGHYLDYKNINGRKPDVNMEEDDNVDDAEPGETDGSMARENLEMIVEYSIKLMEMIKPGDNLASWVSMKLTKASEAISSAKHFIEYRQFEKHASDAFESKLTRMLAQQLSETMSPASNFAGSKKNKLGSAGQLKGNMKRPARAGDLVGGAAESVSEDDEAMRNFLAPDLD